MKKKHVIIICIAAVLLIALIILLIVLFRKPKQKGKLFSDSDYPVIFTKEDRDMIVKLRDENNPKISWETRIEDESKVKVEPKGKDSGSRVSFLMSGAEPGTTTVDYVKTMDVSGTKADLVIVRLPVYIGETNEGLDVSILEDIKLMDLPGVVGPDTAYPVLIYDNDSVSGTGDEGLYTRGNFFFVNGINDWVLESTDGQLGFFYDNKDEKTLSVSIVKPEYQYLGEKDAEANAAVDSNEPMPADEAAERNSKGTENPDADSSSDMDDSSDTATSSDADSGSAITSEIVLSSASLGISESFEATLSPDGTISIKRKASKKK